MRKKLLILALIISVFVVGVVLVWEMKSTQVLNQKPEQAPIDIRNAEEGKVFVTDVDSDISHWQTKETEFFTIKFPREWYWLESNQAKTGYHSKIITNNSNFDIDEYADIAVFSDIGPASPITIVNDSELIITSRGFPTSNAGTSLDALDSIFELAKRNHPSVHCVRPDNLEILPIVAYCGAQYSENQTQLSYYVIDKDLSLTLTLRKRGDGDTLQSILEKIARSIQIKH